MSGSPGSRRRGPTGTGDGSRPGHRRVRLTDLATGPTRRYPLGSSPARPARPPGGGGGTQPATRLGARPPACLADCHPCPPLVLPRLRPVGLLSDNDDAATRGRSAAPAPVRPGLALGPPTPTSRLPSDALRLRDPSPSLSSDAPPSAPTPSSDAPSL